MSRERPIFCGIFAEWHIPGTLRRGRTIGSHETDILIAGRASPHQTGPLDIPSFDANRPWRHLYGTVKWQRRRLRFLDKNPLCCKCREADRIEPASVVDHKTPHKGDLELFWDEKNWQPLCKLHHDSWKQAAEHGNVRHQVGVDGYPIDGSW